MMTKRNCAMRCSAVPLFPCPCSQTVARSQLRCQHCPEALKKAKKNKEILGLRQVLENAVILSSKKIQKELVIIVLPSHSVGQNEELSQALLGTLDLSRPVPLSRLFPI